MERIYDVVETQWGYDIVGPNGHKWRVPPGTDYNYKKLTAQARAFERAYVEGQKAITEDADLLFLLTTLGMVSDKPTAAEIERVALLPQRARNIVRKLERLKFLALRTENRLREQQSPVLPPLRTDVAVPAPAPEIVIADE